MAGAATGLSPALPKVVPMERPIARVLPMKGPAHLDRFFDYRVPEDLDSQAQPGVRVRVRFSGQLMDALVYERVRTSDHSGPLRDIERVISPVRVLPPDIAEVVEILSRRSAGTRPDILRFAIPPRHAAAEQAGLFAGGKSWEDLYGSLVPHQDLVEKSQADALTAVRHYRFGEAFLTAMAEGRSPRASLLVPPGEDPLATVAPLMADTAWRGGGVLAVVPSARHVARLDAYLRSWMSAAQIVHVSTEHSPQMRYRRFLSILAGQARVVIGTRSASLAPVRNLRLVVLCGEGEDLLIDPRAPYLHARDTALLRADTAGAGFIVAGVHRSAEVQQWVEHQVVHPLVPDRELIRERMPWIRALGETPGADEREAHAPGSRIPAIAFSAIRSALQRRAPVVVCVPRRGYAPALACTSCRTSARCRHCNGPLELPTAPPPASGSPAEEKPGATPAAAPVPSGGLNRPRTMGRGAGEPVLPVSATEGPAVQPTCRWCGLREPRYVCPTCGTRTLRMVVVGHDRTAVELGRAFPGVRILSSGGDHIVDSIDSEAQIVVATPGAIPVPTSGLYGAAVILDPWITLGRLDLRAEESALRQWMETANMVDSRAVGGTVVVAGESHIPSIQALVRWDPAAAAARELKLRREAGFPPATSMAAVDGTGDSIAELLAAWEAPDGAEVLGPVDLPPGIRPPAGMTQASTARPGGARRAIIRVPSHQLEELGSSLKVAQTVRAMKRQTGPLRVVMDPVRIG